MKKKIIVSISLIVAVLTITIGYSILSTQLNINGSSKINSSSWDIHFENVETYGNMSFDIDDYGAVITPGNPTEVTYIITLENPGEYYEFTVDAVNSGTIDGMVDLVTSTIKIGNGEVVNISSSTLPEYLNYSVTYLSGREIEKYQYLKAGKSEKYKVRIEYSKDVSNNQLPTTEQTITLSFQVDYVQANNNAVVINHSFYAYTDIPDINDVALVYYNQPLPNYYYYTNINDIVDEKYLKYKVENGIVTERYLEFIITEEMANYYPGAVPGRYTLKGDDPDAYESNVETVKSAFGYNSYPSRCYTNSNIMWGSPGIHCALNQNFDVTISQAGFINFDRYSTYCTIEPESRSYCTVE